MPATVGAVRHSESPADAVALVEPRIESTSAESLAPQDRRATAFRLRGRVLRWASSGGGSILPWPV